MKVRFVAAVAVAITVIALVAGPAAAATTTVNAPWDGNFNDPVSFSQNPVSIAPGDSVTVSFSEPISSSSDLVFWTGTDCTGTRVASANPTFGVALPASVTLTPASSTTYGVRVIDQVIGTFGVCTTFTVNVGTPPPTVSEAPYAAGLLGVVAVALGASFFVLRRRATRSAA